MKKIKIPLWVKILVWTPLGLVLYPKYYMPIEDDEQKPIWFSITNGILMGIYVVKGIELIFKQIN